jgi:hypothetical protein
MDMNQSDSSEKVKRPLPSITEGSDEEIFASFLDEVYQMKKELLPLKHHMGLVLFDILKAKDSSKRPSLEELRDFIQGQYYSIIAQGPKTFGGEPQEKDTEKFDSSQQEDLLFDSIKGSKIPNVLNFEFDLDFIINVRRIKEVITIEEGEVITLQKKFGNQGFESDTMKSRASAEYDEATKDLFGKSGNMKRLRSDNVDREQFENLKKKLKCMRKSNDENEDSGELGRRNSEQSNDVVDLDKSNEHEKII